MRHILGNKVLEYDVDDRGVIVDEREIDRTVNHKPNIADWVKEHMVFWYDMSKPVDVYTQNFNDWQNYNPNSVSITNNKIVVNGLIDNFRIASIGKETESFSVFIEGLGDKNLAYRVKLDENSDQITNIKLKDGENVLPHSFATTVAFMGVIGVTDYIGLTITQLPSGQSVPTNEILKANPYLQDFSGNNRPLKLNNFLFAAMSGVDGYNQNFLSNKWLINQNKGTVKIESSSSFVIQAIKLEHAGIVYRYTDNEKVIIKCNITGITEEIKGKFVFGYSDVTGINNIILENGYFEFITSEHEGLDGWYGFKAIIPIDNCNITVTQIPEYPGALVTDGVDDYGQVQNFKSLQNYMMFYQCAVIKPTRTAKGMFSTISDSNNNNGWVLLQNQGKNISRFGNGAYMNVQLPDDSEAKTDYIVTGNGNKMTLYVGDKTQTLNGTYTSIGSTMGYFLSDYSSLARFGSLAFYKSILFDSVPTKETDGFTEQELIDYVLENLITK
jgi:hypothetical protein